MTNPFDFSQDKPNISEPIPTGTKLLVRMSYTPGGVGDKGALTKAKPPSDAEYLKAEFTVIRGPYKGRKFWENMTMSGGQLDEKGHSKAAKITRGNIRSILDATGGVSSKDESPAACAKRVLINGYSDLQGRVFPIKVGVEKEGGGYAAKNKLGTILTIDHKDYPKDEAELDTMGTAPNAPAKLPTLAAPTWGATAKAAETSTALRDATTTAALATMAGVVVAEAVGAFAPSAPAACVAESALPAWMQP